jgi:5-formyltetrahydrofolate cyclo-ligase
MFAAKDELRQEMRSRRLALAPEEPARRGAQAATHVLDLPEVQAARRVALFAPVRNEIDTRPLHTALAARGVEVAYPRIVDGGPLAFAAVDAPDALAPGRFGIPEPAPDARAVAATDLDVLVVPGLAFDPMGERLGWGHGHYDRTLQRAPAALRVGYAYDFQIVPVVPAGADDERMDVVASESGARRVAPAQRRLR